ncbi:MAG TPA: PilZ domain-containing protein [Bryobacteraceae bacterium]|nr:PilZ domain-containing protein [Bryobacteraceae bacterium]
MGNERRVKARYPVELKVRYQVLGATGSMDGVGQTVNMSSSGMLLASTSDLPEGARVKLFVEWPSLLNGTTPLQLITVGTVVRSTRQGISVVFESYQFRTMSRARRSNVTEMPQPVSRPYLDYGPERLSFVAKSSS